MAANVNEKKYVADINSAWDVITGVLTPKHEYASLDHSNEDFHNAYQVLKDNHLGHIVQEWFLECLQEDLRQRIAPGFWKHFDSSMVDARQLITAVDYLHENISQYSSCFSKLEFLVSYDDSRGTDYFGQKKFGDLVIMLYKAIIFHVMSKHFLDVVDHFYSDAFKVFHHCNNEGAEVYSMDDSHNWNSCPGCGAEPGSCTCQEIMNNFHSVNRKLDAMGLLERVSGLAVTSTVNNRIKHHIENTCKGNFETSYLEPLERWLDNKVLGWLNLVYAGNRTHIAPDCISNFRGRLLHFLYETLADTQIDQLFPIIIDFPDSEPAILDLKVCLEKTDKRSHLIPSFKNALETRLLHPGVNTADILTAYISAIRTLRVLDPAGVILELVCEPVRKYLRVREDTVRCIVSSLTDEGSNELSDELIKGEPLVLDESYHSDEEQNSWHNWMPDPVDADPATTSKSRRSSDIISMLVNIYGSKELFVNEYRTLLADRILTQFNYDTEKEIRYLELLKLRFGEAQLHYCEVMLKDVADSKRINACVAEERKKEGEEDQEFHVNAMILSAQFWPTFRDEKITVPSNMEKSLEEFTKKYEALKGNRTLAWKNHLGLMNIDVELKDRTLNFNVSPVHAAIIMQFQEKDTWTVEELSSVLQMPATALSRKLSYWQSQGLLREEMPDTFVLIEEHKGRTQETIVTDEDETESAMASSHVQREEELQVFWSFIVGMLTNLESLPLPRIHSMLRMFAMQGPTAVECSIPELKAFLDRKVKEQKLVYTGGVYRLAK